MSDPMLDVMQAAEILGVSREWVYKLAGRGELPHYRLGRSIRFRRSELEAFLEAARRGGHRTARDVLAERAEAEA